MFILTINPSQFKNDYNIINLTSKIHILKSNIRIELSDVGKNLYYLNMGFGMNIFSIHNDPNVTIHDGKYGSAPINF